MENMKDYPSYFSQQSFNHYIFSLRVKVHSHRYIRLKTCYLNNIISKYRVVISLKLLCLFGSKLMNPMTDLPQILIGELSKTMEKAWFKTAKLTPPPHPHQSFHRFIPPVLKGLFSKNEREYRLKSKNILWWLLLILLLSIASKKRKLLKKTHTVERSVRTNSETCNIRLGSLKNHSDIATYNHRFFSTHSYKVDIS